MNRTADTRAGRFVMVNIQGTELDAVQAAFLREHGIRAVCLFRWNLEDAGQVRRLTHDLREVMGEDALIAMDQEGGSVVRATFLPQAPAAMGLGACADADLAEEVGLAVARGIRSLGINWNFAPVLDVNNNPANPVIAERSFGQEAGDVVRLAEAWMRGSLRGGVACCVKHFPGHGDTHVDSHRALPVVDKSLAQLQELELVPFAALRAQAPAIMTAHIVYPQLDSEYPATLSRRIIGGLLRDQLGYDGVVITDSLVMKAIHERYGHDRAAVLALQAGADMGMALGSREEQAAAVRAIAAALERGELSPGALARSAARLDALAHRFPVHWPEYSRAERQADDHLMRKAWAHGLTGWGAPQAPPRSQPLRVVAQCTVPSDGVSEAGPSGEQALALFSGHADVQAHLVDDLSSWDAASLPADGRMNVLVSNIHERYGAGVQAGNIGLHLVLWNPFQVLDIAAPAVATWGYAEPALDALRHWLQEGGPLPGRPPVELQPARRASTPPLPGVTA
jgi:beta-N-acetylhexosaminidase